MMAHRNSGYEQPVRQSGYGVRQSGYSIRESGSGVRGSGYEGRTSGYEGRNSGSGMVRESGYGREAGYGGGIRMSSAYEPPREMEYEEDEYEDDDGYPNDRFNQYEDVQGGYPRESAQIRHSGYPEGGSQGFRVRESAGYDNYPPDYGVRQSRPY